MKALKGYSEMQNFYQTYRYWIYKVIRNEMKIVNGITLESSEMINENLKYMNNLKELNLNGKK